MKLSALTPAIARSLALSVSPPGLADDYPESPHAAEAMFRYGRARYRQGENREAIEALVAYMSSIPVNPHLGEVEEMLYTAAIRLLGSNTGIGKIFRNNDLSLNTLDFVAQTFPVCGGWVTR